MATQTEPITDVRKHALRRIVLCLYDDAPPCDSDGGALLRLAFAMARAGFTNEDIRVFLGDVLRQVRYDFG